MGREATSVGAVVPRNRPGLPSRLPPIRKSATEVTDQELTTMDKNRKLEILILAKLRRTVTTQIALCKRRARNLPQMRDSRYRKYDPSSKSSLVLSGTRTRSPKIRAAGSFFIL